MMIWLATHLLGASVPLPAQAAAPTQAAAQVQTQAQAVEVNRANQAELEMIKGIGPQLSGKILAERGKQPFKDWQDLIQRLSGVGQVRAAKLSQAGLLVNGAAYVAPPNLGAAAPKRAASATKPAASRPSAK
jgi:competence protein ComEA